MVLARLGKAGWTLAYHVAYGVVAAFAAALVNGYEGIDRRRLVADIEAWHGRAADIKREPDLTWKGASVQATSRVIGRYVWTTASIDVSVNGKTILRSGGVMKISGDTVSTFEHEGVAQEAALSWGRMSLRSFPYRLEIDGGPCRADRQHNDRLHSKGAPFVLTTGSARAPLSAQPFQA